MAAEYATFGLAPATRAGGVHADGDFRIHRDFALDAGAVRGDTFLVARTPGSVLVTAVTRGTPG
ncbi:hypothetical protein ABZ038_12850 [Streptomyces sp. NPDC006349]|uniref:hypothetical protein n=1 Tax=unclassified Streptomyces TaxID=2593676 RepID=UPI0033A1A12A